MSWDTECQDCGARFQPLGGVKSSEICAFCGGEVEVLE